MPWGLRFLAQKVECRTMNIHRTASPSHKKNVSSAPGKGGGKCQHTHALGMKLNWALAGEGPMPCGLRFLSMK
jgi:hypothetical protein